VVTSTMESSGMESGAHGGVGHLLRMAKTQGGVAVAFAALRKADGGFAIATFPNLTNDPAWTIEAIDELVRQTWDDPVLGGGKVIVRSGRVLRGMWTGQAHHTKMAVAALNDPDLPERPWGLLCLAEPLAGHFEQDDLTLLHTLALRLTSYLRARQELLEGSFASPAAPTAVPTAVPPAAPTVAAPTSATPTATPPAAAPTAPPLPLTSDNPVIVQRMDQVAWIPIEPPPLGDPDPSSYRFESEPPAPAPAADLALAIEEPVEPALSTVARAAEETAPPEPLAGDWALTAGSGGEWVEAEPVPLGGTIGGFASAPPPATDPAPLELDDLAVTAPGADEAPEPVAPPLDGATTTDRGFSGGLRSLLGPDPVTGLASLPTLLGRLAEELTRVRNHEGSVAVVLLDVSSPDQPGPLTDPALHAVAGRLRNRVRENDLVARVDTNLFAVLAHLRENGIDAPAMGERMTDAVIARADRSAGVLVARSSIAAAAPGDSISAEELLNEAAASLGAP
jgi:GGDEF domain-containing protein